MLGFRTKLITSVIAALTLGSALTSAECSREGLLAAAESYLVAQTSGSTDGSTLR